MKNFIFICCLFVSSTLISQEISEITINFRNALKTKNFDLAENLLTEMRKEDLELAKYELLETELWIEKGESLYQNNQFKSAFPYFKNAYERWRTNNFVRDRYNELNSKVLKDENSNVNMKNSKIQSAGLATNNKEIIGELQILNSHLQNLTSGINSIDERMEKLIQENSRNNALLVTAISIQSLVLLIFLIKRK
ncbi:hypothetical protein EHQ16_12655 [Leptospira kanakyensis]|uniref:Tetratricopeptide repeat protein n=1 Tax=Leptospira kanakyensis TaxID=2484968 RepID=A0A6N4QCL5_9LEPT|nr:hypothetical protein [Leptospira kanakyensis]TGK50040.1 hypothetical protein EHQ11_09965 [Leptospira kanakyensis]TGK58442.1 hypothetical protein EHQ16_12655 [Leptospira kanakyensis]TGK69178.1 hypothetical protein EHQ18_10125 [Leptospira kanakyensis]